MIDATQVRIGNWVQDWAGSVFKQVCDISTDLVECEWNNGGFYVEPHPIPLTSDILEKCGLKKWNEDEPDYFIQGKLWFKLEWSGDCYSWAHEYNTIVSEIRHLHQLQNLYFSLTGEELSIEL